MMALKMKNSRIYLNISRSSANDDQLNPNRSNNYRDNLRKKSSFMLYFEEQRFGRKTTPFRDNCIHNLENLGMKKGGIVKFGIIQDNLWEPKPWKCLLVY